MSAFCPNATRGQLSSCSSAATASHQVIPSCNFKHLWLLGMLGPCPLRRRATRTARCSTLVTGAATTHSDTGYQVASVFGVSGLSSAGLDEVDLRMDVEDGLSNPVIGSGLDRQRQPCDNQPVQLVNKPQPRARARPSPARSVANQLASEDGATSSLDDYEKSPNGSIGKEIPPPNAYKEPTQLGLKAKALVVRRKIAEQGFDLQPQQLSAALLTPRVGNFMPAAGERLAQRRLAQLNKYSSRILHSSRKAGGGGGGNDGDSDLAAANAYTPAATPFAPTSGLQYGHPPLTSVCRDVADISPEAASMTSSMASSPGSSRPTSPSSAAPSATSPSDDAAAAVSSRHSELPTPGNLPRPTRAEVERLVRGCSDLAALRMLYGMYGARLTREELVLLVNQLAEVHDPSYMTVKLWTATHVMLVELLQRITSSLKELTMQEYVIMLTGVAKLRYVPPNDWIAAVLTQSKPRLYNASPSNLAHVLKAIARISVDPSDVKSATTWEGWMRRYLTAVQRQLPTFRADELVKTLVALSELRFRPHSEWMHKFSAALHSRLEVLEAYSLSEAMLAFAALRYQPGGPFLRAYYSQLYTRLPLADDQDLATYAQAAALLDRVIRQDFMQEFLAEVVVKLPTFKPQHLANLLNGLGRLAAPTAPDRVQVPAGWTAAVATHMATNRSTFSGSALASAAWGLSMLEHKATPQFLDDLVSASYGKLHTCGPTDLILLATALGNFGFQPMPGREALWATWMAEFERFAARKSYDTRGVCDLMDAIARLPRPLVADVSVAQGAAAGAAAAAASSSVGGGRNGGNGGLRPRPLHPDFIAGVLRSTRLYQLRNTSPGRLAALAGALATLGVRPDFGFLYNYAQAARVMWTSFSTRDYATLLGAMVHIGTQGLADSRWAADFLAITLCRMPEFDGPSLAASLDALRRLPKPEFTPSSQWLAAAANRAVELIRSPPPPLPPGAAAAAAMAAVPAAAMAAAAATVAPVPVLTQPTVTGGAAGATTAAGSGGKAVSLPVNGRVLPMRPLTPELLVVLVEALAALGYRANPAAPLVQIIRKLLSTTAARLQLMERVSGAAASSSATPAAETALSLQHHLQQQQQEELDQQQHANTAAAAAAAAAAAFARAKVAAATAAAVATGEVPRPPLDRQQAAALEAALGVLLGAEASAAGGFYGQRRGDLSPPSPSVAPSQPAAAAGPMIPGLPRTAIRTSEDISAADAAFAAKRAHRVEKRARRRHVPDFDNELDVFFSTTGDDASTSCGSNGSTSDGAATDQDIDASSAGSFTKNAMGEFSDKGDVNTETAWQPGVRMPSYSPEVAAPNTRTRQQSAATAGAFRREGATGSARRVYGSGGGGGGKTARRGRVTVTVRKDTSARPGAEAASRTE